MGCVNQMSVQVNETRKPKIVMIGLEGSGKTAIFEYFRQQKFIETKPTLSVNMEHTKSECMLFDLGGKVPNLWSNYYDNLDGLIIVIDSTNKQQVFQLKDQLVKLNKDLEYTNAVILIMFTKQDLKGTLDNRFLIEESGIYESFDQDLIVQMCSARTGEGVLEGFTKLINFIRKQPRHSLNTQSKPR